MSSDAIVLLRQDHQEIRRVFRDFQKAGKNAEVRKGQLVDKMIELLTVHTYIENEVMYPRVRELAAMKPSHEQFDAKTTVLIENVVHHMDEEEQDWFPKIREGLGRKTLQEIGAELTVARKKAPTRPSQPSALKKSVDAVLS